jgi:hypothetical protein
MGKLWSMAHEGNLSAFYQILQHLTEEKKTREMANSWMLHHGNVPCHMSLSIHRFLTDNTFLNYCNQPTLPTCHHVTSGCSPSLTSGI